MLYINSKTVLLNSGATKNTGLYREVMINVQNINKKRCREMKQESPTMMFLCSDFQEICLRKYICFQSFPSEKIDCMLLCFKEWGQWVEIILAAYSP